MAVQWTSPAYVVTHEKSIVVDDRRALIATFNLVLKYFTETRDYGVITADPAQVAQVAAGFDAAQGAVIVAMDGDLIHKRACCGA